MIAERSAILLDRLLSVDESQFRFQAEADLLGAVFEQHIVLSVVEEAVLGQVAGRELAK